MQRKQESAVKEGKRREAGKARAVKAGRASAKKKACIVKARKRREAGKAWQGRTVPPALSGEGKKRSAPGIGHVRKKGMLQKN